MKMNIIQIICLLLITLWIYTALSKLMDVTLFKAQLSRQTLISEYAALFVWFLPALEIAAALLLMFTITRKLGMLLSFSLMSLFTIYVGLAVFGYLENVPCSCGGFLNRLGWRDHLWFNLFFTFLAAAGIYLLRSKNRKDNLKQVAFSGKTAKG